jgi:hypothetical protein
LIFRVRLACGLAAAVTLFAAAAASAQEAAPSIDTASQSLKRQALELNRDLLVLQEKTLYPAPTQIAVFLAMDLGIFFELQSVKLEIDGREVGQHRYTPAESTALVRGGTQRLYIGNIADGPHELVAVFGGHTAHSVIRRALKLDFDKQPGTRLLELRVSDGENRQEPAFSAQVRQ